MAIERARGRTSIPATPGSGSVADFDRDVKRFLDITGPTRVDMVMRNLGFDLWNRLTLATPRDTGWASSSWRLTRDHIDLTTPAKPEKGSQAPAAVSDLFPSSKLPSLIYVSNNLIYIEALNNGHSPQAPAGFADAQFEATKVNFETIVRQVVANDGGL